MVTLDLTKRALTFAGRQFCQMGSTLIQQLPEQQRGLLSSTAASAEDPSSTPASTEYLVHNWFDALFTWFQMVVLWHDPFVSVCTLSGLFSLFLLLIYFAPRFYATIMIAVFVYNLTKFWFRHVWPEIRVPPEEDREVESRLDVDRFTHLHPHLMTLSELNEIVNNLIKSSENQIQNLLVLRREKPVAFCSIICSTLSCTAYIGSRVSGLKLIMAAISILVLAPGIYLYLLPKAAIEYLKQSFTPIIFQKDAQTQSLENTTTTTTNQSEPASSETLSTSSSPMLSLIERLKSNSFIARQLQSLEMTKDEGGAPKASDPLDVPKGENNREASSRGNQTEEKKEVYSDVERENLASSPTAPRKSSDDLSSNESTSLIDLDEDQQDGFVML